MDLYPAAWLFALALGPLCACSQTDDVNGPHSAASGGAAQSGGSSAGGAGVGASGGTTTGGTKGSGGGQGDFPDTTFEYDPSLDLPAETCAEVTVSAVPLPLDIYVILDRTGSMWNGADSIATSDCDVDLQGAPASTSRWCHAVTALGRYFASDAARGHRAAIQFMMPTVNLSSVAACGHGAANPHSTPAVELELLPAALDLPGGLIEALNQNSPGSGTAEIESALNGIVDYTTANRAPNRKMIAVFVTDAVTVGICNEDHDVLAAIARDHLQTTGVPTFFIGMTDAYFDILETWASTSGGAVHSDYCDPSTGPTCHYWSVGDGEPDAFVAALRSIEETVVGCAYTVPESETGLANVDSVSVELKTNPAAESRALTRVSDEGACAANAFYTVSEAGSLPVIRLCPSTCEEVNLESEVKVRLLCEGE